MAKRTGLKARLHYAFDRTMSAGPVGVIGWLALLTALVVTLVGAFLAVTRISQDGEKPLGLVEAIWETLMRAVDTGNVGGDVGWGFRLVMLVVTAWGIFVVTSMISLLNAGVQAKLTSLRKGRSLVIEEGHTVILNWTPAIFDVIAQLIVAHEGERRCRIVILADQDKVAMEDEIDAKVRVPGNTRIVCRRGDPTDLVDLAIVNLETSKSVILLAPSGAASDAAVIKTLLAIVHDPRRREAPYRIAAELRGRHNAEIARTVGGRELQLVEGDELISRIIVHSSRQSGLSAVYSDLLDFEGCEIYVSDQPSLAGTTYGDALHAFDHCALIGVCDAQGRVTLNPPPQLVIAAGEQALVVAEDDRSIHLGAPGDGGRVQADLVREPGPAQRTPERVLILGWNHRGPTIVTQQRRFLDPGSEIVVAADAPGYQTEIDALGSGRDGVVLRGVVIDTSVRSELETLAPDSFDHIVVLAYSDAMPSQAADTHTLVTLLHLRDLIDRGERRASVVSEMTDIRNRELAEVTRADDFVVSDRLVSLMLAQASENPHLSEIFDEILDPEGSELYLRPAQDYVAMGVPVSFHTVVEAAGRRGESALGYRRKRVARAETGVTLNPLKTEAVTFEVGDQFVVLARGRH